MEPGDRPPGQPPPGGRPAGGRPPGHLRRLLGPFYSLTMAVVVAVVVLALGLGVRYLFVTSPDQAATAHAPRITDVAFEHAANAVCHQYVQVFNTATTLGDQPTEAQSGAFLENIATTFDQMVVKLRALPVSAPDQAAVDNWLAQWDAYDAFGHRYAAAVGRGQERDLVIDDSASQGALRRARNGFARANHMPECAFT